MSQQLDDLTAQVSKNSDVIDSAKNLITGLKTALDAAIASQPTDDGAALKALSDSLAAKDQELADAVAANTPAAPAEEKSESGE